LKDPYGAEKANLYQVLSEKCLTGLSGMKINGFSVPINKRVQDMN